MVRPAARPACRSSRTVNVRGIVWRGLGDRQQRRLDRGRLDTESYVTTAGSFTWPSNLTGIGASTTHYRFAEDDVGRLSSQDLRALHRTLYRLRPLSDDSDESCCHDAMSPAGSAHPVRPHPNSVGSACLALFIATQWRRAASLTWAATSFFVVGPRVLSIPVGHFGIFLERPVPRPSSRRLGLRQRAKRALLMPAKFPSSARVLENYKPADSVTASVAHCPKTYDPPLAAGGPPQLDPGRRRPFCQVAASFPPSLPGPLRRPVVSESDESAAARP